MPFFRIHPIKFTILFILLRYHLCNRSFTPHPHSPSGIIYFSIMTLFNQMPDLIGPVRKIFIQPVMK